MVNASARVLMLVVGCAIFGVNASGSDVVKIETSFTEPYDDALSARADLGDLIAESTVKFEIALNNPTDHDLHFRSVKSNSSYVQATLRENEIKPGSVGHLDVELKVPKKAKGSDQLLQIGIKDEALGNTVAVLLAFRIAGMICFEDQFGLIDVMPDSKEATCKLPVLLTPPIKPENVSVRVNVGAGLEGKIARTKDGTYVAEFRVQSKDLEALKGFGNVTIVDSVSGRIDAMPFAVRAVDEVAVLPSTIRFAAKDGHSVATGLIRVQKERGEKEPLDRSAVIKCYFLGKQMNVNVKPLGRGCVSLSYPTA